MDEFKNKNRNDTNGESKFSVSPQFGKDLRALFAPKAGIPAEIDRRILRLIRRSIVRRRVWKWIRYPAAAAAAVAAVWICAAIWDRPGVLDSARLATARLSVEDIDGNGVVDIRDALCLARKVESHAELDRQWDFNQDRVINRADADSVGHGYREFVQTGVTLMRIIGSSILVLLFLSLLGIAQDDRGAAGDESIVRFMPLHIMIDPAGQPMAAYQFELKAVRGQIRIVGVEGGEHPAFAAGPFYDPAALAQDRIIIAAYNTGDNLPSTKSRVATIHLQILGEIEPEYEIQLIVASNLEGNPIEASIACEKGV